jgi:hypothetical protein
MANHRVTTAKMLLDVYGHFLPTETKGYADALTVRDIRAQHAPSEPPDISERLYASPGSRAMVIRSRIAPANSAPQQRKRESRRPESNRRPADYEGHKDPEQ